MAPITLMAVHAHPDDEVIGTGGTFARYAAEGVQIDTTPYLAQKLAALRVHRTQLKPDWPYLVIPDDVRQELMAQEHFVLLRSRVDAPADEYDLFSGIRDAL